MAETSSRLSSSVLENTNTTEIPEAFAAALLRFLTSSPYILCTVALSYISGHLWAYIILSYFSKQERKILYSLFGKLALGLMWFAIILMPTYVFVFRSFNIISAQLLETFCEWPQNLVKQRISPYFLTTGAPNYYEFTTKE